MKIALFGRYGQLGFELRRSLDVLGDVVACGRDTVDMSVPQAIEDWLDKIEPQLIVNAAAYTAVDRAESEESIAMLVNAHAPGVMARWAKAHKAMLVHYSTDYVYSGGGTDPWDEANALLAPVNAYGRTKLEGEREILAANPQALIFRTSWVFGAHGGNFLKTMLRLFQQKEEMSIIADQVGAPTSARLLAEVTLHTLLTTRERQNLSGTRIYNLAPAGETSWHGYASFIHDWLMSNQPEWFNDRVKLKQLKAIPTAAYPTPAARPQNSRLATNRLKADFNLFLPHWKDGVSEVLEQLFTLSDMN